MTGGGGEGANGGFPTQSPNRTHPLRLRWLSLQGTQSVGPTEWTEGQKEPAGGAEGQGPNLAGQPAQRALTWGAQQGPGGGGRQPRTNSGIQDGAGLPGRGSVAGAHPTETRKGPLGLGRGGRDRGSSGATTSSWYQTLEFTYRTDFPAQGKPPRPPRVSSANMCCFVLGDAVKSPEWDVVHREADVSVQW